jgi:hypothetical protein
VSACSGPFDPAATTGQTARATSIDTRIDPSRVDEGALVTLAGNTHPSANPGHDLGRVDDDFLIEHMQLVLKRSPESEAALNLRIDAIHDRTTPQYHQWLTAAEFGDQYGVSKGDIATLARWLESHGLRVDSVPASRMFVEFSGTAAQIRAAFHTEIHRACSKFRVTAEPLASVVLSSEKGTADDEREEDSP